MAQCIRCGKHGLFLKVNQNSLCDDCERLFALECEEKSLIVNINKFRADYVAHQEAFNEMSKKRANLFTEISTKAKESAMREIDDKIREKNNEYDQIKSKIVERQNQAVILLEECNKSEKAILSNANKLHKIQKLCKSMKYSSQKCLTEENVSSDIISDDDISTSDEILSTTITLKLQLMNVRELRKLYNQNEKLINEILDKYQFRYTTKANRTIYSLMVIALKAELQNILYNITYSKLDKSIESVKDITYKYSKIATDGNQQIAPTIRKFIGEIEYLFIEAVKIEYEYYIQKERLKEEQRALREKMREEAEEQRILKQQQKKIEQEEEKYKNEISNVQEILSYTDDEIKIMQLNERIQKLQDQLANVEKKKSDIIKLQNGKAGYIYVISNLGSFGENVFKVGMTRRQDPQERVNELGDASVPFRFDVHSFIFSENAPELENNLHKQLNGKRVNRVNLRKEFFNTNIDELENMVLELEPTAEFNRTILAEQYYQSISINEVPENIELFDDNNDESYDVFE